MGQGYSSGVYARSLSELGTPLELPGSGGWLLARPIAGHPYRDAIGPYPLFTCADWSMLEGDIRSLRDLVTVTLVPDPIGPASEADLASTFDLVIPFKTHYLVDPEQHPRALSGHHRRRVRVALAAVDVERCASPRDHADGWISLYRNLVRRHDITGPAAFSDLSLVAQLDVPGLELFRAHRDGRCVGMMLWFVQDDAAYYHLGAYDDEGYRHGASYALTAEAIRFFAGRVKVLDLGGAAGNEDSHNGLARFKEGWATHTHTAYLCGAILQAGRYEQLSERGTTPKSSYFPAYRFAEAS